MFNFFCNLLYGGISLLSSVDHIKRRVFNLTSGLFYCVVYAEPGDREDFSKEMAKLDVMEEKRNHLVLSENEEASPDKDTAEGQEEAGEEGPGPAGEDGGVKENEKEGVDPPVGGVESNERAEGGDVEEEEAVGADHDMKIGGVDGKLV